jgi:hypothetical protein
LARRGTTGSRRWLQRGDNHEVGVHFGDGGRAKMARRVEPSGAVAGADGDSSLNNVLMGGEDRPLFTPECRMVRRGHLCSWSRDTDMSSVTFANVHRWEPKFRT